MRRRKLLSLLLVGFGLLWLTKTIHIPLLILVACFAIQVLIYRGSTYYRITKNLLIQVLFDKGKYGEYLTYKRLRNEEKSGAKFLFNIYIPKGEHETTEIDVLMIHPAGLFVFESKNYSGWIFGNENQKPWYQTLPRGRGRSHKEKFYNPIMQNRTHIQHLKALLGDHLPMHSVITFSERCTLKKVELYSKDIYVINRHQIADVVQLICNGAKEPVLPSGQMEAVYDKLYPYTQVSKVVKKEHIENIEKKLESDKEEAVIETAPEEKGPEAQIETQMDRCP